jgi:mannose/cellobiose epimerase-like protein (N-acyl-D-glucosamine 2-epimerase family)
MNTSAFAAPQPNVPALPDFRSPAFLLGHIRHTLSFYEGRALDASGGFFHFFKDDGTVYDRRTRHLVSSTRFIFNHAMAYRRFQRPQDQDSARHGLNFLHQAHAQPQGGFAWLLDWDGTQAQVLDGTNHAYGLAFVLLAHAHALMAGIEEAAAGLHATFALMEQRFWQPQHKLYADEASPDWQQLSTYRGQNANMHACEAMLAAHEATGHAPFLERALLLAHGITQRLAVQADGLVWEHYGPDWRIDWHYNQDDKTNIFRPWGFQVGHLTEWSKLLLQLEARLPEAQRPGWLLPTAERFFDVALHNGWDAEHGGLVYGFAPGGKVCDADKYFWVQAESLAAAALLALRTGKERYWQDYQRLWAYAWAHMIDHEHGAWWRIRTPDNRAYSDEKSPAGKTDYHTMGACWDVLRGLGA